MIDIRNKFKLNINSISETLNYIENELKGYNYSNTKIINYLFLIEEALNKWYSMQNDDSYIVLSKYDNRSNFKFEIKMIGKKINPFLVSEDEDLPIHKMYDRLLSGVGVELKYKYSNNINKLILTLPKNNIVKKIFEYNFVSIILPLTFHFVMISIATYVDSFMLGFVDLNAMASVSIIITYVAIYTVFINSVAHVAITFISQLWGKRDRNGLSGVATFSLKIAFFIGTVFAIISLLFSKQILSFYTNDENIILQGCLYLKCISVSFLFLPIYSMLCCYMQLLGKVKKMIFCSFVGCIVNVILNGILIFGLLGLPKLGVVGAGIATIVSSITQTIFAIYNIRKITDLKINIFAKHTINKYKFFSIIIPLLLQYSAWIVTRNIITATFGHMKNDIIVANSILSILVGFFFSIRDAMGDTAGIIVGASLGKGNFNDAKIKSSLAIKTCIKFSIVVISIFALISYLMRYLPMNFSDGSIYYMNILLVINAVNLFFGCLNVLINNGMLYVGGDIKSVLVIDSIVMLGIMMPISLIQLNGILALPILFVILILNLDEVISFPMKFFRYKQYKWLKNLTNII